MCLDVPFALVNTCNVILYISVLPQSTFHLLLADRYHEIFHLPGTVDVSKLTHITIYELF